LRGCDAGNEIGGSRTGSRNCDTDFPARAREAVSHVGGALLVTDEDVPKRVIQHRVVGGQNRSARISEDRTNPFVYKAFPDDLRTRPLH